MAIFAGKIEQAYYTSDSFAVICVEWKDDSGAIRKYKIDKTHADFKALVSEGWTDEKLAEQTKEYHLVGAKAHAKLINDEVEFRLASLVKQHNLTSVTHKVKTESGMSDYIDHTQFWDTLIKHNEIKDDVFAFKMWILESEYGKKATSDQKKAVRRAKTLLEALSVLFLLQ